MYAYIYIHICMYAMCINAYAKKRSIYHAHIHVYAACCVYAESIAPRTLHSAPRPTFINPLSFLAFAGSSKLIPKKC